jgi:hypothetical protein
LDALLAKPSELKNPEFGGFFEIQTTYARALSLALRERRQHAVEALGELDGRFTEAVPNWMRQAWGLWKADVLLIIGRRQEALGVAQNAVGKPTPQLCSSAFAGPFARWSVILSRAQNDRWSEAILLDFLASIQKYDALDQVEILCAKRVLELERGIPRDGTSLLLEPMLAKLPMALRRQLIALEVLSAH